ncbi:hypothetical protein QO002_006175 [Pararhizobium capsulatum DSM 1112]|uniref:Uncharacterized protein n=1 Tax=Pararhizobium capsulatum DSM 1112 TaxID=1121113 RepID=A0ABU0C0B9_9HYPH|nr:hypothetical protein [Pararhizobium capsulatum DSM 1112]
MARYLQATGRYRILSKLESRRIVTVPSMIATRFWR